MSSGECSDGERRAAARELMLEFARATGLTSSGRPRRYLWTDAFAVCNCLGLHASWDAAADGPGVPEGGRSEDGWLEAALRLVDRVHHALGRHRHDDSRSGWISGLDEEEGERHPTAGGLRIGKELPEREPGEAPAPRLEWDRDGQYYHYLTRWMHALARASRVTGRRVHLRWARELAAVAHERFTVADPPGGPRRIRWKMSIDLSRPLVDTMGAHDPLDGWVTFRTLQRADPPPVETTPHADRALGDPDGPGPDLSAELRDLAEICEGMRWATDDPLGIGGLLTNVQRLASLAVDGDGEALQRALTLVHDATRSLEMYRRSDPLRWPAGHRLPFRELGLAIGLRGIERLLPRTVAGAGAAAGVDPADAADAAGRGAADLAAGLRGLQPFIPLADAVETFWLDPGHRGASTWTDHRDINTVMLATSLAPAGYLGSAGPARG